jgi:hypothetical protein
LLLQVRTQVLRRGMGGGVPGLVSRFSATTAERCGLTPRNLPLSIYTTNLEVARRAF